MEISLLNVKTAYNIHITRFSNALQSNACFLPASYHHIRKGMQLICKSWVQHLNTSYQDRIKTQICCFSVTCTTFFLPVAICSVFSWQQTYHKMTQIANHIEQVTVDHIMSVAKNSTALQSVYFIWKKSVTGLKQRTLCILQGKPLRRSAANLSVTNCT
jgi:hypothetical protein